MGLLLDLGRLLHRLVRPIGSCLVLRVCLVEVVLAAALVGNDCGVWARGSGGVWNRIRLTKKTRCTDVLLLGSSGSSPFRRWKRHLLRSEEVCLNPSRIRVCRAVWCELVARSLGCMSSQHVSNFGTRVNVRLLNARSFVSAAQNDHVPCLRAVSGTQGLGANFSMELK